MTRKKAEIKDEDWLVKAYKNLDFLNSPEARIIRIMSEMIEPEKRFRRNKIRNTVVFFGSSRTLPRNTARKNLKRIEDKMESTARVPARLKKAHEKARIDMHMSRYYEDALKLSNKLTRWFIELEKKSGKRFNICSGGGPGIMAAANEGARKAGGRSVGLNISLPMEQNPNPHQTRDLAFEFHYFFIRKFWFFYLAKALVIFPGGYGTLDEFFELLTIIQTKKSKKPMPVVLYDSKFWDKIVDFSEMEKWNTISHEDLKLFKKFDDIDSAFDFLKERITRFYIHSSGK